MALAKKKAAEAAQEPVAPTKPAGTTKRESVAIPSAGFTIEEGIPAPAGRSKYPFGDMRPPRLDEESGQLIKQSFVVPFPEGADDDRKRAIQASLASSKRGYEQRNEGTRFTVARVEGGVRCWREE